MPQEDHVKVAVRVRPFRNARCIVDMEAFTTALYNPNYSREEPKKFSYDYSYWSHDGFVENENGFCQVDPNHTNGYKYADQETVYQDLGRSILTNAMEGYNSSLYCYGQTGSGKSYSIIGYGSNKGIVPRLCEELFQTIEHRQNGGDKTIFEIRFSMLEIYNELVRDLLNPEEATGTSKKKGLKVREHPTKGFFAEGLKTFLVTNHKEIVAKIDEGTTNRSIASTNMNETSSRAHTIVGITIAQKSRNNYNQETAKTSLVHLVDLAGSERLSGTQAVGDRLKEGVSINQSLACLGNCIHALAEKSSGKNVRVPFRDSVLTRLLMNVLGGNSKTVMIATISPADISFDETLSTLRYADRAKQIRMHAKVNEDPTDKLLRQLRDENDKLKKMMDKGETDLPGTSPSLPQEAVNELKRKWEEEMRAAVAENERQMSDMKQSYEEKLKQQNIRDSKHIEDTAEKNKLDEEKRQNPYLSNLNFDEQLSGKITHIIKIGSNTVGKAEESDVVLYGPSIHDQHAIIHRKENGAVVLEKVEEECKILLNGDLLNSRVHLSHNDRLLFGSNQLFVFVHPEQQKKSTMTYSEVSFELAQEEIASKAGFDVHNKSDQSLEAALLNKDLLEVLPGVEEANAISEELDKNIKFELLLVAPQFLGKLTEKTEVYVKVQNLDTGQEFEWTKEKFLNRLYVMKEMYQNFEEGEADWDLPPERDPFNEDQDTETLIGTVQVYLQPLAFMVELREQLELIDYKGSEVGIVNVEIVPCSAESREYSEHDDAFVDSPSELIGKNIYFVFKILGCRGLPPRFTDVYCRYRIFLDTEDSKTNKIQDTSNPDFNHKKMFSFCPATQQLIDYLKDGFTLIQVWGRQLARRSTSKQSGRVTKNMLQEDLLNQANNLMHGFKMNGRIVDPSKQSIIVELLLMKKQQARQQQRIENIKKLIENTENSRQRRVSIQLVKDLITTTTPEIADGLLTKGSAEDGEYEAVRSAACVIL